MQILVYALFVHTSLQSIQFNTSVHTSNVCVPLCNENKQCVKKQMFDSRKHFDDYTDAIQNQRCVFVQKFTKAHEHLQIQHFPGH